jgi:hypothetical protein
MPSEFEDELLGTYIEHEEYEEDPGTGYRWLNPWAVASVFFGLLSLLTVLGWKLAVVPLIGICLGVLALRQIGRAGEEMLGYRVAVAGIGLSVLMWGVGYGRLFYVYRTQAPPGYRAISYEDLEPDPNNPDEVIPQLAFDLVDSRVFLKGYMYPGRQQTGITSFLLCRDDGVCSYCKPNPDPTDLVQINLVTGLEANYTTHLISLGGKFSVVNEDSGDEPEEGETVEEAERRKKEEFGGVIYRVEVDFLR